MSLKHDDFGFLAGAAEEVAPRLLGCELVRWLDGQELRCRIVETEAYDETDAASHSYKGRTARTQVMFGPPGHLYVYFTYGMHYCCNVVTGAEGTGSAVLIRAIEPLVGEAAMVERRHGVTGVGATNGPAKLCQALAIDRAMNGHNLSIKPLQLVTKPELEKRQIIRTTRIGISQAKDVPWRFYIADNPYVSNR